MGVFFVYARSADPSKINHSFDLSFLIFFGSQTLAFFFATAPQSLQRKRPGLAFLMGLSFLQLIMV